jgi:hypothetical protein
VVPLAPITLYPERLLEEAVVLSVLLNRGPLFLAPPPDPPPRRP